MTLTRKQEIDVLTAFHGLGRNGHAHFSPSSSAGWMNCHGFLLANARKADGAGYDAAYGTVAHEIASNWLEGIRDMGKKAAELVPVRYLGATKKEHGFEVLCDDDMIRHIRRYIEWCEEVELEGDVFIEQRIDYSEYTPIPKQGGTADHFVCAFGTLYITDLKMGVGVRVFVERNPQAMLYALGVYLEWNWIYAFKRIVIRICQPRLGYFGVWECTVEELLAFGEEVRLAADASWSEDARRTPSPKACQWCSDVECPARSELLELLADDAFDDDDVIAGETNTEFGQGRMIDHVDYTRTDEGPLLILSKAEGTRILAWRYAHRGMFVKWFNEIGDELTRRVTAGENVPGWKLVAGNKSYDWTDTVEAVEALSTAGLREKDIFVTEVTSVSKAREALRAAGLKPKQIEELFTGDNKLVTVTPGKPTLAPESDGRPDLRDEVDDMFDDDDV